MPSLPPEILLSIFSFAQPEGPSYHHHPPSISRGPRNPWLDSLRTKKALVLVCKAWSPPATELLYAGIVLRRMGHISALANTLRENHNLASLVRAVRIDMCVVLTHCTEVVREDFEYILTQCTMPVMEMVMAAQPVPYTDVLELDRSIRNYEIPLSLQMVDTDGPPPGYPLDMQQALLACSRHIGALAVPFSPIRTASPLMPSQHCCISTEVTSPSRSRAARTSRCSTSTRRRCSPCIPAVAA